MAKKLIAIVMALALVLSFAACGGKGDDTTTAPETTTDPFDAFGEETTAAPAEDSSATDASATVADDTTAAPADATTAAAGDTTTAAAAKAPQTKEEIVAYFNTAINAAKKSSKSITSNYMEHSVAGEITGIPSALDSVGQKLIKDNMGRDDKKTNVTWTSAADKNANFPVEGETWASKLTAADVKDAALKESNGKYMIRLTTVADGKSSSHDHGTGHAPKAFNVVLPGIIDGYIPSIAKSLFRVGTVSTSYPSSTVTVTVDAATGHVLSAKYEMFWTLYIPLSGNDVVLPFKTVNDYTINW